MRWLAPVAASLLALPAYGQLAPSNAPLIDRDRSDRVEPQIIQPAAPPASPVPGPSVNAAPAAPAMMLTMVGYEGSTLPRVALDAATAPYIGKVLMRESLQGIAGAVAAAYAKSDIAFYAVSIPAQMLRGGALTVRVVEGRLKDYRLAGMSPSMPVSLIEAHMRRLMGDRPLSKRKLERALSLLRDVPGQTVDANIRQGGHPGELVLDLIIRRKQLQFGLLIDNSAVSNVVQGVQAQLSVTLNGMLREGDSTRISAYLPFYPDRYQYYALSHATPIGSDGMTLSANIAHVESRARNSLVKGEATLAGLSINYPVIRSYKTNMSVSASIDGVNSDNYYLDVRFGDYRSRTLRLGASWSHVDGGSGQALSAVVSRGLAALGARPFAGFSEAAFTKVNAQAVMAESVTRKLSVRLSLKGQYSRDNLPVTERFALGGRGAGMAFPTGMVTAERGIAGSAEITWSLPAKSPLLKNAALFAYGDGAAAHATARPVYGLRAQDYSLASAGAGVRIGLGAKWRASAEIAVPVKRPAFSGSRNPRFFFGLGRSF